MQKAAIGREQSRSCREQLKWQTVPDMWRATENALSPTLDSSVDGTISV